MEATTPLTTAARNKMALTYGLVLGLIYIILSTCVNMTIGNIMIYSVLKIIAYVFYFVLLLIFARMVRKANGGYIEFREIFGASFVMLLVAGFMIYVYNYVYIYAIDPDFINKIKDSTLHSMEKISSITEEQLDKQAKEFDKQIEDAKHFNIGKGLLSFLGSIVLDCLFGLIVCAIVKKPKPLFE